MIFNKPLVSVCIPTHNGAKHLKQTIESVLLQTFSNFEIVVSDDGSTDETIEILQSFPDPRITRVAHLERVGAEANWNSAVAAGQGLLIKLLCQDDILYPRCLETEVLELSRPENFDCAFSFHSRDLIGERGNLLWDPLKPKFRRGCYELRRLLPRIVRSGSNPIGQPMAVMFRSSAFKKVGGFRGDFEIDLDMWVRLLEVGGAFAIDQTLSAFRVNQSSWSKTLSKKQFRSFYTLNKKILKKFPDIIKNSDSRIGIINCFIRTFARRLFYKAMFLSK